MLTPVAVPAIAVTMVLVAFAFAELTETLVIVSQAARPVVAMVAFWFVNELVPL